VHLCIAFLKFMGFSCPVNAPKTQSEFYAFQPVEVSYKTDKTQFKNALMNLICK
jgi:hypothetical protein